MIALISDFLVSNVHFITSHSVYERIWCNKYAGDDVTSSLVSWIFGGASPSQSRSVWKIALFFLRDDTTLKLSDELRTTREIHKELFHFRKVEIIPPSWHLIEVTGATNKVVKPHNGPSAVFVLIASDNNEVQDPNGFETNGSLGNLKWID